MLCHSHIHEHQLYHPQRNFSGTAAQKNPEDKFAKQFVQVYRDKFLQIHYGTNKPNALFIHEVPVSGNGIADLLVFSWSHKMVKQESNRLDLEQVNPTIRAFEFKISNWRKGLMQAHRYKYFSNASILVLPFKKMKLVEPQLNIFQRLRVGLWGFSPETGNISCLYTPRPTQQQINKYSRKAIQFVTQAIRS